MKNGEWDKSIWGVLALGIVVGAVVVACQPSEIRRRASTPSVTLTLSMPTTARAPTRLPTLAPTSTLTPNPTVTIARFSEFLSQDARVVFSTTMDCDNDGVSEVLVLYRDEAAYSEGYGLVVEADGGVHHLGGETPVELFGGEATRPPVEIEVYDHNGDGRVEIVVTGQIGVGATAVNIFRWDGAGYPTLLSLLGEDGVSVEGGGKVIARSDLSGTGYFIEKVAAWDGQRYRVSSRYDLSVDLDTCLSLEQSPSCAVVAFYDLLDEGDTVIAYALLGKELQAKVSPEELDKRFGRTLIALGKDETVDSQTVQIKVMSEGGEQNGTWHLRLQKGQWVLADFQLRDGE